MTSGVSPSSLLKRTRTAVAAVAISISWRRVTSVSSGGAPLAAASFRQGMGEASQAGTQT
ncbi:hypothetical protein [Brevundimonas diminuta]|uniref:hypothetical protein n=1 Tax=Brevundimonas diminuta TaxID=293 RepID=UPI003D9AA860